MLVEVEMLRPGRVNRAAETLLAEAIPIHMPSKVSATLFAISSSLMYRIQFQFIDPTHKEQQDGDRAEDQDDVARGEAPLSLLLASERIPLDPE